MHAQKYKVHRKGIMYTLSTANLPTGMFWGGGRKPENPNRQ